MIALAALLLSLAPSPDDNSASLLTELVTNALGSDPRLEVVSSGDVRRQIELEANKEALGCTEGSTSCLVEIAGAMGAQLVVYGKLGALDDVVVLTLNLFDSSQGRAVGRVAIREASLALVADRVDTAAKGLIANKLAAHTGAEQLKVLVLDVEALGAQPPETSALSQKPMSPVLLGGISSIAGGAVVGGVGVVLYVLADASNKAARAEPSAAKAQGAYDTRDGLGAAMFGAFGLGGAAVVVGGVLVALSGSDSPSEGP